MTALRADGAAEDVIKPHAASAWHLAPVMTMTSPGPSPACRCAVITERSFTISRGAVTLVSLHSAVTGVSAAVRVARRVEIGADFE